MKFDVTKEKNYIEKKKVDMGNEKGITLIALITSIIIMLILSAISLNATIGQNGIINNARNAKLKQEGAEVATEIQSGIASLDIEYYEKATSDAGITINSLYSIEGLSKYVSGKVNGFNYSKNGTTTVYYTNSKGTYTVKIDNQGIATTFSGIYLNKFDIAKINMKKGDKVAINNDDKAIVWKIISNGTEQTIENNVIEKSENGTTIAKGYKDGEVVGTIIIEDEEVFGKGDTEIDSDTENKIEEFNIGKNGDNVKANILQNEDGTYKIIIKGSGEMADEEITEKSTLSDLKEKTKELVIDNGITNIGANAFKSFNSLQNVVFGKNITTIGESAFEECTSLQNVVIDNSISVIEAKAFYNCSSIKDLYLGQSIQKINEKAFNGCGAITNLVIPENVNYIGINAFDNCSKLETAVYNARNCAKYDGSFLGGNMLDQNVKKIKLGENVEVIPENMFKYLDYIKEIKIPNSVKTIGSEAFYYCIRIESLDLGDGVEKICDNAFGSCSNLKKIKFSKNLKNIEGLAFAWCSSITELNLNDSLEEIDTWAFMYCQNIKNIKIPNSVKLIGDGAFEGCTSVNTLELGNSIETIGEKAFYGLKNIEELTLPESLKSIGEWAFYGCDNIKTLYYNSIHCSTEYIFDSKGTCGYPFQSSNSDASQAYNIDNIIIGPKVEFLDSDIFRKCRIQTITIPSNVQYIAYEGGTNQSSDSDGTFTNCSFLKEIIVKKPENSLVGAPWSNVDGITVKWEPEE